MEKYYNDRQFDPNQIVSVFVELYSSNGVFIGCYPKKDIALMLRDRVAVLILTGSHASLNLPETMACAKYLID